MNPLQVFSQPRHMRCLYFIDSGLSYNQVLALVNDNLRVWGGRYNPIVPVLGGAIEPAYLELIRHYDPDFVFHSGTIDPELIKQLRFFNPTEYVNFDVEPRTHIQGLSSIYLASEFSRDRPILMSQGLFKVDGPILDYFRVNFGIRRSGIVGEAEVTNVREQIGVGPEQLEKIHEIIHTRRPVDRTLLAGSAIDTPILRNLREAAPDSFEIVIAKDATVTNDLLYFWNRRLYECNRVFYLTLEQLTILKADPYFGAVLYDLAPNQIVDVVSLSMTLEEVQQIIEDVLRPLVPHRFFRRKQVDRFPFDVLDNHGFLPSMTGPKATIQTLSARETLLLMPVLPFRSDYFFHPQEWAVDIEIRELRDQGKFEVRFPLTTDTNQILKGASGRINRSRRVTYFMGSGYPRQQTVDLELPSFHQLLRRLIPSPVLDGVVKNSPYKYVGPHDSSNRLSAVIQLFGGDFNTINEYLSDKFWADLFVQLCKSEKAAGDSITFAGLIARVRGLMAEAGHPLGSEPHTWRNEENLTHGLKDMVQELTTLTVLIPGYTLKCPRCSTKAWYSLDQVTTKIRCSGCLVDFALPIEPPFAYRLNGLVQKNLYQSRTQPDGNYTVIRTLAYLSSRARGAFEYSPQLNLYADFRAPKPETDLDIIALEMGKLVVGEAKHDSEAFRAEGHKALNSLAEIAEAIRPDRVLLACTIDSNGQLEKSKKYLENVLSKKQYRPVVETYQVEEPSYYELGGNRYFRW